jgi:hypothetical protein
VIDTGLVTTIVVPVLGSGGFTALVVWWSNRGKSRAETAEKLVASAMTRMDRAESRVDRIEEDVREFRRGLFPHQQWDLQAHRKALEVDPDFPAPPELHI